MTAPKLYQQFFTPQKYSQVMINALNIKAPKKIIDLTMGEGSLLLEAKEKWLNASYYGNDIDPNCCRQLLDEHADIYCTYDDIFLNSSINKLIRSTGKVDLCLGNPPFHKIKQSKDIKNILKQFKLDEIYKSEFISSEVPFILQNLKILKQSGTLALILPDGFFANDYLKAFRQFLIENYQIEKVIELPQNIFKKTQAKTHILILKNILPLSDNISLFSVQNVKKFSIKNIEAINRMDYSHYLNMNSMKNSRTLLELGVHFIRGKSKCLIQGLKEEYILHTTNFSKGNKFQNRLKTKTKLLKYENKIAIEGDIIFARVGTNSVGNVGMVRKGFFIVTDCIFIMRIDNKQLREEIYQALLSNVGKQWIQAHLKGVAAKHITLGDMKKFPMLKKKMYD